MPYQHDERMGKPCKGFSLGQQFYTDPEIYRRELDRIFGTNWLFAGHVSQIPDAGDYFLFELDAESVIIVRDKSGAINALANVCRHRGSRICLEPAGSVKMLRCPYHAWAYDLEGELRAAANMGDDFNRDDYPLHTVNLEIISGLIFICLSDTPPDVKTAKANLEPALACFGIAELKIAAHKRYPIAANWKLAVENYHECYHCGPAHPEYAQLHTLKLADAEFEHHQAGMRQRMAGCGIVDTSFDFQDDKALPGQQGYALSRSALFEGIKTGSKTGEPLAPLLGRLSGYDGGASDLNIGPVSFFLIYSDHLMAYRFLPSGAQDCICEVFWFVRDDAVAGVDYDEDALTWLWDVTTKADEKIIVNNQKGVSSRHYQPGPFSQMEDWTQGFVDWYLAQMRND
jgi:phenylpropionate dioxygenase-like ring-hydroxylating dioxygenase large terminal subunit